MHVTCPRTVAVRALELIRKSCEPLSALGTRLRLLPIVKHWIPQIARQTSGESILSDFFWALRSSFEGSRKLLYIFFDWIETFPWELFKQLVLFGGDPPSSKKVLLVCKSCFSGRNRFPLKKAHEDITMAKNHLGYIRDYTSPFHMGDDFTSQK